MAAGHRQCQGFLKGWNGSLPAELRRKPDHHVNLAKWARIAVGFAALLFAALFLVNVTSNPTWFKPEPGVVKMYTRTPTYTPLPPTATLTPLPTGTQTSAPPTPGPALETPFGPKAMFLIHQVADGESMILLIDRYRTSREVLQTLNDLSTGPLLPGQLLVIAPNRTDPNGLTRLYPEFLEKAKTVETIAQEHATSISDLRKWNGLGDDDWVQAQRWIVVSAE
ncbi:MAG: LysM peptidoglycan-binding domain-containing protein [Anaerolineaceae bacterium]|nr:LysM peptidoglycan-binding domain-containing protein [Anaerolineaceae bacterium]